MIARCGAILPNDGSLEASYYGSYFCKERGAVSLLGCREIAEAYSHKNESEEIDGDWRQVFSFKAPFTLLLAIDPASIPLSRLVHPQENERDLGSIVRPFMRPGEVCHVGPIDFGIVAKIFASLDCDHIADVTAVW